MKEGFTFKWASLKFLRKVIFKNFGGGGENRKEPLQEAKFERMEIMQNFL